MLRAISVGTSAVFIAGLASVSPAQFIDDQFNGGSLGAQWTFVDSNPAGSTHSMTGTHFQIDAAEGADFFYFVDNHAYIQQDAPAGTNWAVETKIDNFVPTQGAAQQPFNRAGIQLWQDNDHWIAIGVLGNIDGTDVGIQAFWQTGPDTIYQRGTTDINTVTAMPMYLRIAKSPKGYLVQYGTDGTTWTDALLIRNPDTADGYFTGEKIRLYQSSAPDVSSTTVNEPADFDYAVATTLPAPPSGYQDDEFTGSALGSNWQYFAGVRPGTLAVSGGTVKLTPGDGQDFWIERTRAMHISQDAPPNINFDLTVKVLPTNLIPFEQWQGVGLVLWQDQSNWVAFYNQRSETGTNRVEAGFKRDGTFNSAVGTLSSNVLPEYLRIIQAGSTYTVSYSYDNVTFTNVAQHTYPAALKNAQVQLINKRVFSTGDAAYTTAAVAEFDWIHANIAANAELWELYQ